MMEPHRQASSKYCSNVFFMCVNMLLFVCVYASLPLGHFFVVEADLREFAQVTVDKRFLNLLSMLRHCQRLKELRGGGLTRYQLL